jgi:chromosome segregation ATPase
MKNQMGIIVLILICAGLSVVLVLNQKHLTAQQNKAADTISTFSNKLVRTTGDLEEQRQVNILLTNDLTARRTEIVGLTNKLAETAGLLAQTADSLKATQEQVAQRDSKIASLESQNQVLDQRAFDLSASITNLTVQIEDTQKKLAASEGDKAFLQKELQRLMAEKAELERQFNDLTVLRAQVAKLKEELSIARRLEWIRQGLFARDEQKGAQLLLQKSAASASQQPKSPSYDLNVEVSADGTVRVIPPLANTPGATNPPATGR